MPWETWGGDGNPSNNREIRFRNDTDCVYYQYGMPATTPDPMSFGMNWYVMADCDVRRYFGNGPVPYLEPYKPKTTYIRGEVAPFWLNETK